MNNLITETLLGEKHMVDIIVYLSTFGSRSRTEIYRAISTSPRMSCKIDKLQQYGLVSNKVQEKTNKRSIDLTPLGRRYAEAICDLERRTGGNIDVYKSETIKSMISDLERNP